MTDRYTDAEQLLIGRLLLGGEYYQVAPIVNAGHFQTPDLARVFVALAALSEAGLPINRLGLQAQLGSEYPRLRPWLADLYTQGQVSGPAVALAEVVLEGYHRRRALALAERLATAAYDDTADIVATQAAVAGELLHGRADRQQEAVGAVAERVAVTLQTWSATPLEPGQVRGLATGLRNVDTITGGLLPGYHIVAGRAGMGKTALALQIAANVAGTGGPVFYLTFEISPDLLLLRLASARSGVPVIDGYTRNLKPDDGARLRAAVAEVGRWPLEFYAGTPQLSAVVAALHRTARNQRPALIIIDNLGHVTVGERVTREYDELNQVSRRIKETANALAVPVLALHQLSRGVESRENKRPNLADLRGSGHLEQDADAVWLLYRPGYYDGTADPNFSVDIAKNRLTGKLGTTLLYFTPCAGLRDAVLNGGAHGSA